MRGSTGSSCRTSGAAPARRCSSTSTATRYKGREHWTRLWQYYKDNVDSGYWRPFDIGGVVSDDLAVIWCERHTHSDWVGKDPMPSRPYGKNFVSRSTMVFRKEAGDWRVVHVHFSPASEAPRPGGV